MPPRANTLATVGLACLALLAVETALATDLEVRIDGLRSAEGHALIALHQRVAGVDFPDDAGVVAATHRRAVIGSMRFIFTDLPPGDYAVAALHDANRDGALARNVLGMPTEGYGFSNGARGFMGPPSFDDATVTVEADACPLSITVPIGYPGS